MTSLKITLTFAFACCSILLSKCSGHATETWSEKTLIKDLLRDYEKRARPVSDGVSKVVKVGNYTAQQLTVEFGLGLVQILQLDENEQILTVSVKSRYRWPDYHLVWNPEEYENITQINIPTSKLWTPDILLYNYADERLEELRECAATVTHDGIVEWHPMAIYKSTCKVKIKYFPYDRQNCSLQFSTWAHDNSRVNISLYEKGRLMEDYTPSPEWDLINHSVNVGERAYVCCPERWTDMIFNIIIERQPAYYNYVLILPCFLLSSVTLVLFWLPPETPAKMVLGMNIFVAFFLLLLLLEDSIPSASSSFPLIGNYYCTNMTLVTLSTFLCLIVVNLHFRGDKQTDVPPWLRKLAIQHGARFLLVNVTPPPPPGSKKGNTEQEKPGGSFLPFKSPFGFIPTPNMPYSDRIYPNASFPPPNQLTPYGGNAGVGPDPRFFTEEQQARYYSGVYPQPNYPLHDNGRLPYSPTGDPSSAVGPYFNPTDPYSRYPYRRPTGDERNRSCAFCPACAGLAAAAAAGGLTDSEGQEPGDEEQPQHLPLPGNPFVEDPTEDLAAVWTAAMTGSVPRAKHPNASNNLNCIDPRLHQEDGEENLDAITSVRDRSIGPDLEAFLLECIRPNSAKKAIAAANSRWKAMQQQGLPPSPFYQFTSPNCEDDEDEESIERWPSTGHIARPETDGPVDVSDSDESVANAIWRSGSGAGVLPDSKKRPSVISDPTLLKRVQRLKRDVAEIVRCIRFMQRQNEKKEKVNKQLAEWRAVGMVLDRLFFVIYLCALGISIMVYFPRSGNKTEDSV
ncbi:neuronal acetylcholine receptor subunit alpha-2 [Clonorchis sinensis]|uniref:Neuronal acetylcholine receptor subunit alpha-2 n=1 Tax=Clonorchis sinensis TaxID=79923 RepID=H2KNI4_CLOSI|nr:neuronal acetylcholine receptor subunit alpha-2 [Clonorchis sinensis]